MIRTAVLFAVLVALLPSGASAQQAGDNLTEQQRRGRQLLAQSCGVCHLPPSLNARTYGPPLNKTAANGDDTLLREYILAGTPRMPSFKHYLNDAEVDAIIAYVRTVPTPAPAR
jgi:mono/diheme cytochrome c family protein